MTTERDEVFIEQMPAKRDLYGGVEQRRPL